MKLPVNVGLPFFTYGLFQPGEPCFPRLEDLLGSEPTSDTVGGLLLVRDGLPFVRLEQAGYEIHGFVLQFIPGKETEAYELISDFEPSELYRWETVVTSVHRTEVNVLTARSPNKGHLEPFEGHHWSFRHDPVFRDGLKVVDQSLQDFGNQPFHSAPPDFFDWPRFFRLQMAYMLLWAAIERYTAFAFGPALDPMQRVKQLGMLGCFQDAVRVHVSRTDVVTDSRDLAPCRLNPATPATAAKYYYQIRNNLSHRGKGAWHDGELVRMSLEELLKIFREVLQAPNPDRLTVSSSA